MNSVRYVLASFMIVIATLIWGLLMVLGKADEFLAIRWREAKTQAVQNCLVGSHKSVTTEQGKAEELDKTLYRLCMKDIGYDSVIQ